jgi:hypothetical protein
VVTLLPEETGMGVSLALILSNKSSRRADRPCMRVLLFATERCVREEYAAALGAAGHHLVIAPTRSEAFDHLASRHDGVVVVEGNAPSAAREVLKRARMADVTTIVWCAEAPPTGFAAVHVKSAAGAVACLQALVEDRPDDAIRVLAIATEPRLAICCLALISTDSTTGPPTRRTPRNVESGRRPCAPLSVTEWASSDQMKGVQSLEVAKRPSSRGLFASYAISLGRSMRARHLRRRLAATRVRSTDVSDEEWALAQKLLPQRGTLSGKGRPAEGVEVDMRHTAPEAVPFRPADLRLAS